MAQQTPNMPLFYEKPEPLDPKRHAGLALRDDMTYAFTAGVNALPLNMVEMPQAALHYPVAFSPDGRGTPVAIVGLRDDENLFVGPDGRWDPGAYIPAYARRYPFIFSQMPAQPGDAEQDGPRYALCVDAVERATVKGGARAFFGPDGKPAEVTNNALEFCKSYQAAAQQTEAFGAALADAGLLVAREVDVDIPGKHRRRFSGIHIVDEKKLAELDEGLFVDWRGKGWLMAIYAHLISGGQWDGLGRRLGVRMEGR
jgi:hypothetical protein